MHDRPLRGRQIDPVFVEHLVERLECFIQLCLLDWVGSGVLGDSREDCLAHPHREAEIALVRRLLNQCQRDAGARSEDLGGRLAGGDAQPAWTATCPTRARRESPRLHNLTLPLERGSDPFGSAWTSQIPPANAPEEGTSGSARECPHVTAVCHGDNPAAHFAGISAKPSDGLEPSTPSLPWRCSTS